MAAKKKVIATVAAVATSAALLLGGTMEKNMRRALVISRGSWSYFVTQPISCVILVLVVITFCAPFVLKFVRHRKKND